MIYTSLTDRELERFAELGDMEAAFELAGRHTPLPLYEVKDHEVDITLLRAALEETQAQLDETNQRYRVMLRALRELANRPELI